MPDLSAQLLELIRRATTELPQDVENSLTAARGCEAEGAPARRVIDTILKNAHLAKESSTPICQDTGTPNFRVRFPSGYSLKKLKIEIREAVAKATSLSLLRPNAVDGLSGINSGDNLGGGHFPFHSF